MLERPWCLLLVPWANKEPSVLRSGWLLHLWMVKVKVKLLETNMTLAFRGTHPAFMFYPRSTISHNWLLWLSFVHKHYFALKT
ncbi:hypothetical protein XELAEV_18034706mg [Xenopus laevis]|uniref:Uncharacterized protein n=1 Tax=Xenopus laevis TaxID=8355 RepID=A0A974CEP7_XENLA|nr:hypothetical protein XELAEV_18034706mg [Xenopus laevis]